MKKNLVIYMYGWNGGEHSKGLIAIREQIQNADILTFEYNQENPIGNYDLLDKLYDRTVDYKKVLVIGNSLGGYWANYMVENYENLYCILINPSLSPAKTIGKYGIKQEFLDIYKPSTYSNKNKWLYLSLKDDIINPGIAEEKFNDCLGTEWLNEPHAIQDYSFMIDKIKDIL